MNWSLLQSMEQLREIEKESGEKPVVIFKHSTRCSISRATLDRLERNWKPNGPDTNFYFLDLITYRDISNQIAQQFQVEHESPQVLIIKDGKAVYNKSHFEIDYNAISEALRATAV